MINIKTINMLAGQGYDIYNMLAGHRYNKYNDYQHGSRTWIQQI